MKLPRATALQLKKPYATLYGEETKDLAKDIDLRWVYKGPKPHLKPKNPQYLF